MAIADLDRDGRRDALIGAMYLENILADQRGWAGEESPTARDAILLFRNEMPGRSP
ncbi:MAG: hypothetical protein KY466_14455 [Gemmatimonadetes bacterium]|nr:hypothetical protein [Gemmatimonadota bacterium]